DRLQTALAKQEAQKQDIEKRFAELSSDADKAAQFRERYEQKVKSMDEQIERTKEQIAEAGKRKPVDLDHAIEDAFIRTVSRMPTSTEFSKAKEDIAAAQNPADGLKEVLWAMLNTREFIVNH